MKVAVFSALRDEVDHLVERLDDPARSTIATWPVWVGSIAGIQVVVAQAGLGKVNIAALSSIVWERHQPGVMLFSGVAGSLDPRCRVSDIVIGERSVQHDAGVLGPDGLERYQPGHIPFFNPTDRFGYSPSDALLGLMREVIPEVRLTPVLGRTPQVTFGTILTGDQFLHDAATRDRLHAEFSAQAIEMEGAALAQTAERLGVDHLIVRSLSDLAGGDAIEDFERFLPEVAANSARLIVGLIERLEDDDRDLALGT